MFYLPENGRRTQEPEANAAGVSAIKKTVLEPNSVLEGFIYMTTYKRTYTFKLFVLKIRRYGYSFCLDLRRRKLYRIDSVGEHKS